MAGIFDTEDKTAEYSAQEIQDAKTITLVARIFDFLFFLPLVTQPTNKYGRFHANQGLLILIIEVAYGIISTILGIALAFVPVVGGLIAALIDLIIGVPVIILWVIGIINAAKGEAKRLPVIGKIDLIK